MKCIKVKENFSLYSNILAEVKYLNDPQIKLSKLNNKNTAVKKILCNNRSMRLYVVNMPEKEQYNYTLKDDYFASPLIRLDTDGPAHINKTLYGVDYIIRPPHFHKFNSNGYLFAYFPSHLENIKEKIQNNPLISLHVFCNESNIECPDDVEIGEGIFSANHFYKNTDNMKFIDNLAI